VAIVYIEMGLRGSNKEISYEAISN
jgi:hypothetical protein